MNSYGSSVLATGYGTTWVNTGKFEAHSGLISIGQRAKVSTVDATFAGSALATTSLEMSGFEATWTNQGTLSLLGGSTINIGAFATLVTESSFITDLDDDGGSYINVHGLQAAWINSGVVLIEGHPPVPILSIDIDDGGAARFGVLWVEQDALVFDDPVHLRQGSLMTDWVYAPYGGFDFAAGRLDVGNFTGTLENTQEGKLAVGEVYPSTRIEGDYIQGPSARVVVTVTGPSATPLLQIQGDTLLDGRLEVRRASAAVTFHLGDSLNVFDWAGPLQARSAP